MALKDIFKVTRKTFFNPSSWLGFSEVKRTTNTLREIVGSLFVQPPSGRVETFEQALKRMNVSEEELQERASEYLFFALVFVGLGAISILFSFYLIIHHHTFAGFLVGLAAAGLFLSQAFKYHFWYFQMKQRKLGCTLQEYKQFLLGYLGIKP